jgi:hypothetical protein
MVFDHLILFHVQFYVLRMYLFHSAACALCEIVIYLSFFDPKLSSVTNVSVLFNSDTDEATA